MCCTVTVSVAVPVVGLGGYERKGSEGGGEGGGGGGGGGGGDTVAMRRQRPPPQHVVCCSAASELINGWQRLGENPTFYILRSHGQF